MNKMSVNPLILIIDDIPENIQVLLNILQQKNYRFAIATNANDAYKAIESEKPDLILLDIILPQINGYEICKKLKSDEKTADIPVIFLTVLDEIEDILRGFQMGAVDYITKPYNEHVVLARVKNIIQIEESRKILEKQNKDKDKFISILAHDLKNPFTNILSFSKILLNNTNVKEAENSRIFEALYTDALRGTHLLENLLIWTKSSSNIITKPAKTTCYIKPIVNETFQMFETNANRQKVVLQNKLTDEDVVFADTNMMETIMRNLISNAIKFTREGQVSVWSEANGDFRKIAVSDTGDGIEKEIQKDVFTAGLSFSSESFENKGTGLGLSICKEFVELNGGRISLESSKEQGTTFFVELPVRG